MPTSCTTVAGFAKDRTSAQWLQLQGQSPIEDGEGKDSPFQQLASGTNLGNRSPTRKVKDQTPVSMYLLLLAGEILEYPRW